MTETSFHAKSNLLKKDIREYFNPADKAYMQRMKGFIVYCAFLVIPVTAAFLGQFRTGAAFIAIFMVIFLITPWVSYFQFLKKMKEEWSPEELNKDFAEAADVFKGDARVGKQYTFFRKEPAIVPTKDVKEFIPLRARSGVVICAVMDGGNKTVTKIKYYKDMMPDLQAMLDEANNSLQAAGGL